MAIIRVTWSVKVADKLAPGLDLPCGKYLE